VLFDSPLRRTIYLSAGIEGGSSRWWRTQRFGCTGFSWERPYGSCAHYHRGVDIARGAAGSGDPVYAPAAGRIIYSGTLNDGSKSIVILHGNGIATGYGHLSSRAVSAGQQVSRGQRIGAIGSTGNSTGPHLHWSMKSGFSGGVNEFYRDPGAGGTGRWVDPWPLLEQNVTVRPGAAATDGTNLRTEPKLGADTRYATVEGDRLVRVSDGKDLGARSSWRKWGGTVTGASYTVDGHTSNRWERIQLDGRWLVIASLLAQKSAN